jgi:hypothetical protein
MVEEDTDDDSSDSSRDVQITFKNRATAPIKKEDTDDDSSDSSVDLQIRFKNRATAPIKKEDNEISNGVPNEVTVWREATVPVPVTTRS